MGHQRRWHGVCSHFLPLRSDRCWRRIRAPLSCDSSASSGTFASMTIERSSDSVTTHVRFDGGSPRLRRAVVPGKWTPRVSPATSTMWRNWTSPQRPRWPHYGFKGLGKTTRVAQQCSIAICHRWLFRKAASANRPVLLRRCRPRRQFRQRCCDKFGFNRSTAWLSVHSALCCRPNALPTRDQLPVASAATTMIANTSIDWGSQCPARLTILQSVTVRL